MRRLSPLPLLALLLAACDSGEPASPNPLPIFGEFSTAVTSSAGDHSMFSGNTFARFDGDALQSILLSEANEDGLFTGRSVMLSPTNLAPPRPGTYTIGDVFEGDAPFTAFYSDFRTLGGPGFFAQSGTLTLDGITESMVTGSFVFEGRGRPTDPDSLSANYDVRGTFEALVTRPPGDG